MTMQMTVRAPVPNVIFAWKATSIHDRLAFTAPICNTLILIICYTNTEPFGVLKKFESCTQTQNSDKCKSALSLIHVEL